jgi:hypothetical protein
VRDQLWMATGKTRVIAYNLGNLLRRLSMV